MIERDSRTSVRSAARVTICIATYRRPRMLATLLKALDRLTFAKGPVPRVNVVVIDNDAEGSAQESIEQAASRARWRLCYGIEPQRGISYARNRGVAAARGCDFVVFIDDDEVPCRSWLDELLFVQATHDADVVAGPVLSRFEALPPAWIERGRFFKRPRYRTGHPVSEIGAGNVLVRAGLLVGEPGPFRTEFALTGAEDAHLFMRLAQSGVRMVWADEAVVEERVPQSRMNWKWILQRAYSGGNGYTRCEVDLRPGRKVRCLRAVKGAARVVQGFALLVLVPVVGIAGVLDASMRICLGAGMLTGLLGHRYEQYRRAHGA